MDEGLDPFQAYVARSDLADAHAAAQERATRLRVIQSDKWEIMRLLCRVTAMAATKLGIDPHPFGYDLQRLARQVLVTAGQNAAFLASFAKFEAQLLRAREDADSDKITECEAKLKEISEKEGRQIDGDLYNGIFGIHTALARAEAKLLKEKAAAAERSLKASTPP
jgi:hypothetical protein